MTLRQSQNPYGYKDLLVYKKAEELQKACASFTSRFPHSKTLLSLADQMDRSARSIKQNIVEGWKRNGTKEYYDFLGFSIAANAELEEDCDDIIRGIYKGIEWEKGDWEIQKVEKLPFYPLDSHVPPLVQLKLRCKELNFLLQKLQNSLQIKMQEGSRGLKAAWGTGESGKKGQGWLERTIAEEGLVRLADGRLIPKQKP